MRLVAFHRWCSLGCASVWDGTDPPRAHNQERWAVRVCIHAAPQYPDWLCSKLPSGIGAPLEPGVIMVGNAR